MNRILSRNLNPLSDRPFIFFQGLYTIPSWKWGHFWFLFAEPVYVCFLTFVFDFLKRVRVSRDRYITNGKRLPIYTSDEPVDWLLEAWSLEIIETRDFVTKHVLRGWILQSKDICIIKKLILYVFFFGDSAQLYTYLINKWVILSHIL